MILETLRLVAAGVAALVFLYASFRLPLRDTWDHQHDDQVRVSKWMAAGTLAAALSFGCEVAAHFWPSF